MEKQFPSFSPNLCSSSLEKYVFQPQEKSLWPYISLVSEQINNTPKNCQNLNLLHFHCKRFMNPFRLGFLIMVYLWIPVSYFILFAMNLLGRNPEGEGLSTSNRPTLVKFFLFLIYSYKLIWRNLFITSPEFFSFETQQQTWPDKKSAPPS